MDEILAFPDNRDFWFQNGVGEQQLGDRMVNADLGRLIRYMMAAEEQALAAGGSRSEGIRAARDAFYRGDPARDVDRFFREQGGIVRYEDLAGYEGRWEEPLGTSFRGYNVYTGDGWSQGPRIVLMLNMLEHQDLRALGYARPGDGLDDCRGGCAAGDRVDGVLRVGWGRRRVRPSSPAR